MNVVFAPARRPRPGPRRARRGSWPGRRRAARRRWWRRAGGEAEAHGQERREHGEHGTRQPPEQPDGVLGEAQAHLEADDRERRLAQQPGDGEVLGDPPRTTIPVSTIGPRISPRVRARRRPARALCAERSSRAEPVVLGVLQDGDSSVVGASSLAMAVPITGLGRAPPWERAELADGVVRPAPPRAGASVEQARATSASLQRAQERVSGEPETPIVATEGMSDRAARVDLRSATCRQASDPRPATPAVMPWPAGRPLAWPPAPRSSPRPRR